MENVTDLTTASLEFQNTSTVSTTAQSATRETDALVAGVLFTIVVVNLSGNSIVITVLLTKMRKSNPGMGVLLLSLAAADCSAAILSALPAAFKYALGTWILGRVMCKIHGMGRTLISNVAVGTLVLIGIERFRTLGKPSALGLSRKNSQIAVAVIWFYNVLFTCPYLLMIDTIESPEDIQCTFRRDLGAYSDLTSALTYITRIVNFMIPVAIMIVCYVGVVYRMRMSGKRVADANSLSGAKGKQIRKVTLMCVIIVAVFVICVSPQQIILLMMHENKTNIYYRRLNPKFWLLKISATCINPVIYGIMLKSFREQAFELCFSRCGKKCLNQPIGHGRSEHLSQKPNTQSFKLSTPNTPIQTA